MKFEDPMWVAGVLAVIGGIGAMIVTLINSFRQNRKIDENTKMTAAAVQSTAKIEGLVNGTQTALLQKVAELQMALNVKFAEVRSLQVLNASLAAHLDDVRRHPAAVEMQTRRDEQQDRRDERQDQRDMRQLERAVPSVAIQATLGSQETTAEMAETLKEIQQGHGS